MKLVVAFGIMLAGFGIFLTKHLSRFGHGKATIVSRVAIPLGILAVAAVPTLLWIQGSASDDIGFLGITAAFFAAGQLLTILRSTTFGAPKRGIVAMSLCAGAFAVGVWGLSNGFSKWATGLVGMGVLLAPIGLSLWTEDALRSEWGSPSRPFVLAGIGLVGAGLLLMLVVLGIPLVSVSILGVLLPVLVFAISTNTNFDVTLVVIAVALAFSLAPRYLEAEWVDPQDHESVLVALGDSFMSGEGATNFLEGTNEKGLNECRRAPSAYPAQLVRVDDPAIPDDLIFLGCSGALAVHIYDRAQHPGEPIRAIPEGTEPTGLDQLAHYEWLRTSLDVEVRLVIVSIGGNDAGFGEMARLCIGPGDCSEIGQRWLDRLENLGDELSPAYEAIRSTFGPTVPIVVVPYPVPIRERGCPSSTFTGSEHRFLNGFTNELDDVIRASAAAAHFHYLAEMKTSLEAARLRLCDGGPGSVGVNFLAANPVGSELLAESLNPLTWFHNSLHPNKTGHTVMASTLETWIRRHPQLSAEASSSGGAVHTVASFDDVMGGDGFEHCGSAGVDLAYCDEEPNDWFLSQTIRLVPLSVAILLITIVGAWLLSFQAIRARRSRLSSVSSEVRTF